MNNQTNNELPDEITDWLTGQAESYLGDVSGDGDLERWIEIDVADLADRIVASDWLVEYVATKQAEALREAADEMSDRLDMFPACGRYTRARWAEWFIRDRADRLANPEAGA